MSGHTGTIRSVPSALLRARDLLGPALKDSVAKLSPEIRRVAGYHLGFVDAEGRPSSGDGGKAVRPALVFLSAEAVGSPAEVALPGAVALELVHNFSLLHDDVMDHDLERRHRPTAWALFGVGQAIVTGDALMLLAQDQLSEPASPARSRAARALSKATAAMIAGQAEDLSFESRLDVSVEECFQMTAHKTGALLSCAASIGAILAGADEAAVGALADFGLHLGLAFQAVDDVLGIWGHPEVTGKPVASDLRAHKKALPVVIALASSGEDRDRLLDLLSNGSLSEETLALATELVERCGGKERTQFEAERQLEMALASLHRVPLEPVAREQLAEIAAFVTARDF
jgi:geranylgeranyl diphosphate synthase type I